MLDGTYAGLLASIADFLNRADLTASIPDYVILAEEDIQNRLRVRAMQASTVATISTQTAALPTDFLDIKSLYNQDLQPMDQFAPDALQMQIWQGNGQSGTLKQYAILGVGMLFNPIPDVPQPVYMTYYQQIPSLSTNIDGNWLSLSSPGVYLYGSLIAAAPYLQDDDRVAVWQGLYGARIQALMDADARMWGERLTPQPGAYSIA